MRILYLHRNCPKQSKLSVVNHKKPLYIKALKPKHLEFPFSTTQNHNIMKGERLAWVRHNNIMSGNNLTFFEFFTRKKKKGEIRWRHALQLLDRDLFNNILSELESYLPYCLIMAVCVRWPPPSPPCLSVCLFNSFLSDFAAFYRSHQPIDSFAVLFNHALHVV